jgi:hypothetical protein
MDGTGSPGIPVPWQHYPKVEHIFVEGQLPDDGHQANQSTAGGETFTASNFVGGESAFTTHLDQVNKYRGYELIRPQQDLKTPPISAWTEQVQGRINPDTFGT